MKGAPYRGGLITPPAIERQEIAISEADRLVWANFYSWALVLEQILLRIGLVIRPS